MTLGRTSGANEGEPEEPVQGTPKENLRNETDVEGVLGRHP